MPPSSSTPDAGALVDAAQPDSTGAALPDGAVQDSASPVSCAATSRTAGAPQMLNLSQVAVGNIDGDRRGDLVGITGPCGCTPTPARKVTVFHPGEHGELNPSADLSIESATAIALGDVNGDQALDALVGTALGVSVALNGGNGFGPIQATTLAFSAEALATADVDSDGKLDIVIAGSSNGLSSLQVLLGKGDGSFQALASSPIQGAVLGLAAFDFDGDGRVDVATSSYDTIALRKGDGTGLLAAPTDLWHGRSESFAVADIDGDRVPDIVARQLEAIVLIGGIGRASPTLSVERQNAAALTLVDANRDGRVDLVTTRKTANNNYAGFVDLRLGDGTGHFGSAMTVDIGAGADLVAPIDTDGDGAVDLALSGWFSTGRPYFNVLKSLCQ